MGSYLDSPLYRQMMAQALAGNVTHTRSGIGALGDVIGNLADAYSAKQYGKQLQSKEDAVGQTYKDAFAPQVDPALLAEQVDTQTPGSPDNQPTSQPTTQQSLAKLLSNPDVAAQLGPSMAGALVQNQAKANEPITPYENAQLARQGRIDDPSYQGQVASAKRPTPEYAGQVAGAQSQAQIPADLAKLAATQAFTAQQNQANRDNQREVAGIRSGSTGNNVQSVQPLGDGTLLKVFRDGHTELTKLDGSPVSGARYDPTALFNQKAAEAGGKAAGTAAEALPTTQANFDIINQALASFDDPKVKAQAKYGVGYGGMLPTIPGVNSDFNSRVAQLKGETFLQAFNTLRGGGQITEVEGAKATDAIARLSKAQTPDEFYTALTDAKKTFGTLFDAAKTRAGRGATVPQLKGGATASHDELLKKYGIQ